VRKALLTTRNDLSLPFFADWEIYFYDSAEFPAPLEVDLLYCRDPFNQPDFTPDKREIDQLISSIHPSYSIDHISNFSDMRDFEDKWRQYQRYRDFMPVTWLAPDVEFQEGAMIAKPRISQRAKNICLTEADYEAHHPDENWIIQEKMEIREELRAYVVRGEILPDATIKSSKTSDGDKVKVIGTRPLQAPERDFVAQLMAKMPEIDLVGLDLAILPDGGMRLIEANRSPQFKRYIEFTGINLIERLENGKNT